MTDTPPADAVPLSHLPSEEKAKRSGVFGHAASHYERYRPGPPLSAVDWILPSPVGRVVDLGAGTGALTRLLVDRADDVVGVEPDDRMRAILARGGPRLPGAGRAGRVDTRPRRIGRRRTGFVVVALDGSPAHPGRGGAGPRPRRRARRAVVGTRSRGPLPHAGPRPDGRPRWTVSRPADGLARQIMADADRPDSTLEIPDGVPFDQPDHQVFRWDVALNADDLIGLLNTFSWIIAMDEATRNGVLAEARRLLRELLGVEGEVTVDVAFRAEAWRSRRHS